jgi:hypothetical protein
VTGRKRSGSGGLSHLFQPLKWIGCRRTSGALLVPMLLNGECGYEDLLSPLWRLTAGLPAGVAGIGAPVASHFN